MAHLCSTPPNLWLCIIKLDTGNSCSTCQTTNLLQHPTQNQEIGLCQKSKNRDPWDAHIDQEVLKTCLLHLGKVRITWMFGGATKKSTLSAIQRHFKNTFFEAFQALGRKTPTSLRRISLGADDRLVSRSPNQCCQSHRVLQPHDHLVETLVVAAVFEAVWRRIKCLKGPLPKIYLRKLWKTQVIVSKHLSHTLFYLQNLIEPEKFVAVKQKNELAAAQPCCLKRTFTSA